MPALADEASGLDLMGDDDVVSTMTTTAAAGAAEPTVNIPLYIAGVFAVLAVAWFVNAQLARRCARPEPARTPTPPGKMLNRMTLGSLPNDVDTDLDPAGGLGLKLIDESKAD